MTIRPPWQKLFFKKRSPLTDYSVSPVHDIEDDVDVDEPPITPPPPTLEPLVTGVTDEYPTSELIFDEGGDIVTDG